MFAQGLSRGRQKSDLPFQAGKFMNLVGKICKYHKHHIFRPVFAQCLMGHSRGRQKSDLPFQAAKFMNLVGK